MWFIAARILLLARFFPETYGTNILHHRAARTRRKTGDSRYYAKKERIERELRAKGFIAKILYRPFEIIIRERIVLAFDIYIALFYGAFSLF
ncbi:LAQU0S13e00518g1_1 [Lachancea quebecensis]|uniref:LAQU0S13e00518g1_1 n=1 Tax=Lachancea quebecensis TaxID=1654605 RepID=A0A0P1KX77_9SACH|nr:LAQU0S13e00518g1_1 [Lachancea quebecensis]